MKVSELVNRAGYRVFCEGEDREIENGYCGDFLSNIISRAPEKCAWLTVMNNVNVAAVAVLIDCACIILCEGTEPDGPLFERAKMQCLWVLGSAKDVFLTAKEVSALCGI